MFHLPCARLARFSRGLSASGARRAQVGAGEEPRVPADQEAAPVGARLADGASGRPAQHALDRRAQGVRPRHRRPLRPARAAPAVALRRRGLRRAAREGQLACPPAAPPLSRLLRAPLPGPHRRPRHLGSPPNREPARDARRHRVGARPPPDLQPARLPRGDLPPPHALGARHRLRLRQQDVGLRRLRPPPGGGGVGRAGLGGPVGRLGLVGRRGGTASPGTDWRSPQHRTRHGAPCRSTCDP